MEFPIKARDLHNDQEKTHSIPKVNVMHKWKRRDCRMLESTKNDRVGDVWEGWEMAVGLECVSKLSKQGIRLGIKTAQRRSGSSESKTKMKSKLTFQLFPFDIGLILHFLIVLSLYLLLILLLAFELAIQPNGNISQVSRRKLQQSIKSLNVNDFQVVLLLSWKHLRFSLRTCTEFLCPRPM